MDDLSSNESPPQEELLSQVGEMPAGFYRRGLTERVAFDFYDAYIYGRRLEHHSIRLFGNSNIGNPLFTNTQVAGQMSADATAFITNWYARTNIPAGALLDTLGEYVRCWLHIGMHPTWQASLGQLLKRAPGMTVPNTTPKDVEETLYLIAKTAYENLPGASATLGEDGEVNEPPSAALTATSFDDLSDLDKRRWWTAAKSIYSTFHPTNVIVLPVRRHYSVEMGVYQGLDHINKAIDRWNEPNWDADGKRIHLLTAPPGQPCNQPWVWIHLEGYLHRPVY